MTNYAAAGTFFVAFMQAFLVDIISIKAMKIEDTSE